uniref:Uncharacterized protein n=1 Tax=Spongospora subterranea TaxID=70186 RepID=A0A0H5QG71_9EUKA|eukprot:CRZ01053.1 hypothetical protein [Spongospora subterranea]
MWPRPMQTLRRLFVQDPQFRVSVSDTVKEGLYKEPAMMVSLLLGSICMLLPLVVYPIHSKNANSRQNELYIKSQRLLLQRANVDEMKVQILGLLSNQIFDP